jgi:hypothetical protein
MGRGYSGGRGRYGGRSYGGHGSTGDYGYGARGEYGQSQFGGGAEEQSAAARDGRAQTPEEYWRRYFGPAVYEGRTSGDLADRFVPAGGDPRQQPAHRMRGPSRHPLAPRQIHRTDAELYEDVCEALMRRVDLDTSDVSVTVSAGTVSLEGTVPERSMRYLIEDVAAGHPAVRDVDNRIAVRQGAR